MKDIPKNPGVYLFKDSKGKVIYVGKAKNLKNRVSSYFNKSEKSAKTKVLVSKIKEKDYFITNTEVEALLLENKLIKEYKPKYNINLKDDKTYAYIKVTAEKFPRIISTRRTSKKGKYFGPYINGYKRSLLVKILNKHFKLCTKQCMNSKSRLNFDLGLCCGACIGEETKENYKKRVEGAVRVLRGNISDLKKESEKSMNSYIENEQYEFARVEKEVLDSLEILTQKQTVEDVKFIDQDVVAKFLDGAKVIFSIIHIKKGTILGKEKFEIDFEDDVFSKFISSYYYGRDVPHEVIVNEEFWESNKDKKVLEEYLEEIATRKVNLIKPQRGDKKRLVELAIKNVSNINSDPLRMLKEKLSLKSYPRLIESFDVSNLKDEFIVSGMVCFENGKPLKNRYRRFRIKSESQDDFYAMSEAVYRRYKGLKERNEKMPDLILIDGGLGQLNSARLSLKRLNLNIEIISIAKREEEIYKEDKLYKLDKQKEPMLLLRKIRDETHRFSINYNKILRSKELREWFKK
ncbi:MAG: excinuclease ABC subunit UvrC [Candidatus Woesearchaeota archaeon]